MRRDLIDWLLTLSIESLRKRPDKVTVCLSSSLFHIFTCRVRNSIRNVVVYTPGTVLFREISQLQKGETGRSTYNSVGSCETTPIRDLQDSTVKSRISAKGHAQHCTHLPRQRS